MIPNCRRGRLPVGIERATGNTLYLSLARLFTHLHILGPPGCGKSRLLLWIFQCLCYVPNATIIMINPKGALCRMARDWAVANGFGSRIDWIEPGTEPVIGYNPLLPGETPISTQVKSAREIVRASTGQGSFDGTPQLARFLYFSLGIARNLRLTLEDSLAVLRSGESGARFRLECAQKLQDPFLRDMMLWFHSLPERRQDELAASTVARLEAFVCDPIIRPMLVKSNCFSMAEAVRDHRIVLCNLEIGRPLRIDDVKMLGRFIVNDAVNEVFASGSQEHPVFLILDEVQNFATSDLCSVLDMGRELGLCGIFSHQYLKQLKDEERSGVLYDSMLSCARNKVMFGGLSYPDLEVLTKETMIDQFDPYSVKDEIRSLELEPVETRREIVSVGENSSMSWAQGTSATEGKVRGSSTSRSRQHGQSHSESAGFSNTHGLAESSGEMSGITSGVSTAEQLLADGSAIPTASISSEGAIEAHSQGMTEIDTSTESQSYSDATFQSAGSQRSKQQSTSTAKSRSDSLGGASGTSISRTLSPFYEYRKQRVVSSRTFWSLPEFWAMCIQKLQGLRDRRFAIHVPHQAVTFADSPQVKTPWVSASANARGLSKIFSRPAYAPEPNAALGRSPNEKGMLESKCLRNNPEIKTNDNPDVIGRE